MSDKVIIKTDAEIQSMRRSGQILSQALDAVEAAVRPGVTTLELDHIARGELSRQGAQAAFLGYNGFPGALCVSVNDEIVHGIPGSRMLKEGDIVGIDLGVVYEGMITDGARTVAVGQIDAKVQKLLDVTRGALDIGINSIRLGGHVGDISSAIQSELERGGLTVIEDLSGHGVGRAVHEGPMVPNVGKAGRGAKLVPGMTLAIEPMASLGSKDIAILRDGWTIVTTDRSWSAQFEHTIAITQSGAEILTKS